MTHEEAEAFIDALTEEVVGEVPEEARAAVFTDERFGAALLSFRVTALEVLASVQGTYLDVLRAAKSRVVAAAPIHAFTIERLLARTVERVAVKAGAGL